MGAGFGFHKIILESIRFAKMAGKKNYILDSEQLLGTLENEVVMLKKNIRNLTSWKYIVLI